MAETQKTVVLNNRYNGLIFCVGGEFGIKSKQTRRRFYSTLLHSIHKQITELSSSKIHNVQNIFLVKFENENKNHDYITLAKKIADTVFGISMTAPVVQTTGDSIEGISNQAISVIKADLLKDSSFAVRVKRIGTHSFHSKELERKCGALILKEYNYLNLKVNLTNPQFKLNINIRDKTVFFYWQSFKGLEGLPQGIQGSVVAPLRSNEKDYLAALAVANRGGKIQPLLINHQIETSLFQRYKRFFLLKPTSFDLIDVLTSLSENGWSHKDICHACDFIIENIDKWCDISAIRTGLVSGISLSTPTEPSGYLPDAIKQLDRSNSILKLRPFILSRQNARIQREIPAKLCTCAISHKMENQIFPFSPERIECLEKILFQLENKHRRLSINQKEDQDLS